MKFPAKLAFTVALLGAFTLPTIVSATDKIPVSTLYGTDDAVRVTRVLQETLTQYQEAFLRLPDNERANRVQAALKTGQNMMNVVDISHDLFDVVIQAAVILGVTDSQISEISKRHYASVKGADEIVERVGKLYKDFVLPE